MSEQQDHLAFSNLSCGRGYTNLQTLEKKEKKKSADEEVKTPNTVRQNVEFLLFKLYFNNSRLSSTMAEQIGKKKKKSK